MHPDRSVRIHYMRDGKARRGLGLRIGGPYVLTADHCANGTDHWLTVERQKYKAVVYVRSNTVAVDLAVLIADDLPEMQPLPCAFVNRDLTKHLDNSQALGFPSWRTDPLVNSNKPRHVLAQSGKHTHGPRSGRDGPAADVSSRTSEAKEHLVPTGALEQPKSVWAGMSGAGIITSDDVLIGAVRSHTVAEGGRSLTVTPLVVDKYTLRCGRGSLLVRTWRSGSRRSPPAALTCRAHGTVGVWVGSGCGR